MLFRSKKRRSTVKCCLYRSHLHTGCKSGQQPFDQWIFYWRGAWRSPITSASTSYLLRYSFDQIPKGQRITHAEWVIPASGAAACTVHVWRVTAEWGIGACHQYRMTWPKRLEWSVAGARGKSVDRATNPTGSGKFTPATPQLTINVTQDVELWHSGASPNRGWLLTFDAASTILVSPTHTGRQQWQLRITYEPE